MPPGTHQEIVAHPLPHQLFVQVRVDLKEEILITAVENERQFAVPERRGLVDHRMRVPALRVVFQFAQLGLHLPRIGEGTYIHAARGRTCGPETVFVPQCDPKGAVTAHAEARNSAPLA